MDARLSCCAQRLFQKEGNKKLYAFSMKTLPINEIFVPFMFDFPGNEK